MKHKGISGNVYNHAEAGGYLSYFLYPDVKVFIDGRMGILYPYDFSRNEYILASNYPERFQPLLANYSFDYILAPNDLAWCSLLRTALLSGRFELVCSDIGYTFLAKTEKPNKLSQVLYRETDLLTAETVEQMKLDLENSDGDLDGIQELILQFYDLYLKQGSQALSSPQMTPYYIYPILTRCAIRLADRDGNHQLGLALLKRLPRLGENDYLYLIRFHLLAGNIEQAEDCIRVLEQYYKTNELFIKTETLAEELQIYLKSIDFLKSPETIPFEALETMCQGTAYNQSWLDHLKREKEKRAL
ncbi:MAG: hypothetical protein CSA81_09000 [Acidobacteria bacterium]|nr:MAG: hypothetical protein CSA81_09000 [Acidobacteriota bacterium]